VVDLVAICKGRNHKVSVNLKRMLGSLMARSNDVLINVHVLTDEDSKSWVEETILNVIGRHLTEGVVFGFVNNNVTLQRKYLDVDQLSSSIDRELLDTMKKLFGPIDKAVVIGDSDPRRPIYFPDLKPGVELRVPSFGHTHLDLFFIGPFYHQLLPHLDQVIVVDLDLEFRVGIDQVYKLFSHFTEHQVMGLVGDQSAYYPFMTSGSGPARQGLNSGLVLFQLSKMRHSAEYNRQLNKTMMHELSNRYMPHADWSLGDQDWFSLLSWQAPDLVATLPCQFNVLQCNTIELGSATSRFANIPCQEEIAIAHFCGKIEYV